MSGRDKAGHDPDPSVSKPSRLIVMVKKQSKFLLKYGSAFGVPTDARHIRGLNLLFLLGPASEPNGNGRLLAWRNLFAYGLAVDDRGSFSRRTPSRGRR
jgi:hypothetical protein